MWLISPALALRSEGADQSPAERAFSLHTERRSTLSHPFTRATPAVCLRQNSASVLKWCLHDNMTRQTHTHTQTRSRTLTYLADQPIQSQSRTLFDVVKSSNLFWWGLWRALSLLMKAVRQLTIHSSAEEIHWFFHLFQIKITYKREITWLRSFRMEYVTMKTEELILALIMK